MNCTRKHLLLGLGVAALIAAPRVASAEASFNFRKAYTGTAGGNNYLDAGYRIEYGMEAAKSGAATSLGADAQSNTYVKLFGKQFDATRLKATHAGTVAAGCSAYLQYETYLVGIKIPTLSGNLSGGVYNQKYAVSRVQQLTPTINVDFVRVGGAALGFNITTTATEYMRVNGTIWCNQVSAELRPGAYLTIKAAFRADVLIAAAGIRGTLSLMDTSLPMAANVSWQPRSYADFFTGGSYCTWQLNTSATANLEIVPVSGKFEAYVRVGPPCFNVLGLFSGNGICINEEFNQVFWNYTGSRKVWPLIGSPLEYRIGDNTATCGPAVPPPPARS